MNTTFPNCIVGTTTCPDDTTDYIISATELAFAGIPGEELDGAGVEYFVRYPDNVTAGFESGYGIYTHSTRTVTRLYIYESSATGSANNDPVNWGSSAVKHIALTVSGNTIGNMARIIASLNPWEDILVGFTAQSNGGTIVLYDGAAPPDTNKVLDWSTAGSGGAKAWRKVVKSTVYTDYTPTLPYIGTPRSVLDSNNSTCGSILHSMATQLATFTGRKVRTVSVFRSATSISDPTYGWLYNPSATDSVAKVFADAVDAAIAQMHIDDPRQSSVTKLHIYMMAQGENEAAIGQTEGAPWYSVSSSKYAHRLHEHIEALKDDAKWGIANDNTLIVLNEIPDTYRSKEDMLTTLGNGFNGHAQAQVLIGERCIVISTAGIPTQSDLLHYTGEGADLLGARVADVICNQTSHASNTGGAFRQVKNYTWPNPIFSRQASSASAPSLASWRLNVAENEIKIHKTAAEGIDAEAMGVGLFKVGDILKFELNGGPSIYVTVTLTSTATDNTTYFSYSCTVVITGVQTTGGYYCKPQNIGFHDGKSYLSFTGNVIQSGAASLANSERPFTEGASETTGATLQRNFHHAMLDPTGRLVRSAQIAVRRESMRTDDATTQILFRSFHFEDGRVEYVKATVCYKVPANGNVGVFILQGVFRRTGISTVKDGTIANTVVIDEEALATDPVLVAVSFLGISEGYRIDVVGKNATNIDWVCEVEAIEIPNQITST
jgi:hypothetical protein